jgi:hypothetical protein
MPYTGIWARDLVTDEENAVTCRRRPRSWLELIYRRTIRTSPSQNSRLLSHRVAYATKAKGLIDSGYAVLTIRSVVIHVALVRMSLAPSTFVRGDVLRLGKIFGSHV